MENECVKWYEDFLGKLFEGNEDSWVYQKITELSAKCEDSLKESLIEDTKLRSKTLLNYTYNLFTGDRMQMKSYQMPFVLHQVTKEFFEPPVAAIATEASMVLVSWDYRVYSNILRFILFDDNPEEFFIEKMTVFFMALDKTIGRENRYIWGKKDPVPLAEFYSEMIEEMEHLNYEQTSRMVARIRASEEKYYHVYDPILWKIVEYDVPDNFLKEYKRKSHYSHKKMEGDLVDFIKMDMDEYISSKNPASYSPFWIFGTGMYEENIKFILKRKQVIEFNTVWYQYLDLKSKAEQREGK